MSSFFTRSTVVPNKPERRRRRSSSVAGGEMARASNRIPAINVDGNRDVATLVCTEISRALLMAPNIDLGRFLSSVGQSRRDICISDSTVLISVSILEHIGNHEMAAKLLSKSATLTKYYEKMGLHDKEVRAMLVIMLFTLNPGFVQMIEKTVELVIKRSSEHGRKANFENQVPSAMVKLLSTGEISGGELKRTRSFDSDKELSLASESRRFSLSRAAAKQITPDDSVSKIGDASKHNEKILEPDLLEYINRSKKGNEPPFKEIFKTATSPIASSIAERRAWDKSGLGYKSSVGTAKVGGIDSKDRMVDEINKAFGGLTVVSIDPRTGVKTLRQPRVEDFLDSEEPSESVYNIPADLATNINTTIDTSSIRRPLPTELSLPNSTFEAEPVRSGDRVVRPKDSFEEMLQKDGYMF